MSESTEPQAATIPELQAAFPGEDKFTLECAAKGSTLIDAKAAFCDHLQARIQNRDETITALGSEKDKLVAAAEKPARGAAPVTDDVDDTTPVGDPVAMVNARVQQLMATGLQRHTAHERVMSSDPALRQAYVNAACQEHGRPLAYAAAS